MKRSTSIVEPFNLSKEYPVPYQGSFKSTAPSNFVDSQNILHITNYKTTERTNEAKCKKNPKGNKGKCCGHQQVAKLCNKNPVRKNRKIYMSASC